MANPVPSGTTGNYAFDSGRIIEHAFRRAGLSPEQASSQDLEIAQDLIYTILATWVSSGVPLWTQYSLPLGCSLGSPEVPCPTGTVDVVKAFWRNLVPWRGAATTSTGVDATVLFAGAANSDVTISSATAGVGVYVNFGLPTEVDTIGVLIGGSSPVTLTCAVSTSPDGATWTTAATLLTTTFTPGRWAYFDLNPIVIAQYVQISVPAALSWTVNQLNFGLANASDTPLGVLNVDDYYNLPNKFMSGNRAVSFYLDRQITGPVIKIWNILNPSGFYGGTVTAVLRRYINDPGKMTNSIEIPARGAEALIWRLAHRLIYELPDRTDAATTSYFSLMAKQQRIQQIEAVAAKEEALFWSEERNVSPVRVVPNLRPYTR